MLNMEDHIWEDEAKIFNFHNEIPGKVKMHTRSLKLHDWVKIDKTYPDQMKLREDLLQTHKDEVFVSRSDESVEVCKWELFEELIDYLPKRFPDIFELKDNGFIYNKVLQQSVSTSKKTPEDPLIRAGKLTQEDWVIIEWSDEENGYVLTAGLVYFPMRWSLLEKFNKGIAMIHEPVKPFAPHLKKKVYDVFKNMTPESPIWRANWAVFNDLKGPLDLHTPTGSLDRKESNTYTVFKGDETGKALTFRAEYQTLRKLPKTKCIIFGIRTYQRYLNDFENFPDRDSEGLIKAIENLNPDFLEYKGAEFWKKSAIEYLNYILEKRKKKENNHGSLFQWFSPAPTTIVLGVIIIGLFTIQYKSRH